MTMNKEPNELFNHVINREMFYGTQIHELTPTKIHLFTKTSSIVSVVDHLIITGNLEEMAPFYKVGKAYLACAEGSSDRIDALMVDFDTPQHLKKLSTALAPSFVDLNKMMVGLFDLSKIFGEYLLRQGITSTKISQLLYLHMTQGANEDQLMTHLK